ncbi:hypothetical protein [Staphylococcus aureus]|uniref:hypothetical protein n=1 Tax=Staphylococcus aureus TaxID=1280 RepID=UPI0039BDCF22
MEVKEVPLVGKIKYAQMRFAACPNKKVMTSNLIANIPPRYDMLLSISFCKERGGEI